MRQLLFLLALTVIFLPGCQNMADAIIPPDRWESKDEKTKRGVYYWGHGRDSIYRGGYNSDDQFHGTGTIFYRNGFGRDLMLRGIWNNGILDMKDIEFSYPQGKPTDSRRVKSIRGSFKYYRDTNLRTRYCWVACIGPTSGSKVTFNDGRVYEGPLESHPRIYIHEWYQGRAIFSTSRMLGTKIKGEGRLSWPDGKFLEGYFFDYYLFEEVELDLPGYYQIGFPIRVWGRMTYPDGTTKFGYFLDDKLESTSKYLAENAANSDAQNEQKNADARLRYMGQMDNLARQQSREREQAIAYSNQVMAQSFTRIQQQMDRVNRDTPSISSSPTSSTSPSSSNSSRVASSVVIPDVPSNLKGAGPTGQARPPTAGTPSVSVGQPSQGGASAQSPQRVASTADSAPKKESDSRPTSASAPPKKTEPDYKILEEAFAVCSENPKLKGKWWCDGPIQNLSMSDYPLDQALDMVGCRFRPMSSGTSVVHKERTLDVWRCGFGRKATDRNILRLYGVAASPRIYKCLDSDNFCTRPQ